MDWIKKNLGLVAFFILLIGAIISATGKFFYDKDYSSLAIISFLVFGTLEFIHQLLNKTPKTKPWKIFAIIIVTIMKIILLLV